MHCASLKIEMSSTNSSHTRQRQESSKYFGDKIQKEKTGKRDDMLSAICTQQLMNLYDAFLLKSEMKNSGDH